MAIGTVLLLAATSAVEAPAESPFARILALHAAFGLASPTGAVGATVEVSPIRYLALEGGVGRAADGLRGAAMLRARLPLGVRAIGLGIGSSMGAYEYEPLDCEWPRDCAVGFSAGSTYVLRYRRAHWLDGELAFEARDRAGATLRLAIGARALLNPGDRTCYRWVPEPGTYSSDSVDTTHACEEAPRTLPLQAYARLTVGWSL